MAPTDHATPAPCARLSDAVCRAVHELFVADNGLSPAVLTDGSARLLQELPAEAAVQALRAFVHRHRASRLRGDRLAAQASLQHLCCEFWADDRQARKAALVAAARGEDLLRDTRLQLARAHQTSAHQPQSPPQRKARTAEWSPALRAVFAVVFTAGSGLSLARLDAKSVTALRSMSCADAADVAVEFACAYVRRRASVRNVNRYLMGIVRNHMTRKSARGARAAQVASRSPSPLSSTVSPRTSPSPPGRAAPAFLHVPRCTPARRSPSPSTSPVPTPPLSPPRNDYHLGASVSVLPQPAFLAPPVSAAPAGWVPVPVAGGYVMVPPPHVLAPFAGLPPLAVPPAMPLVGVPAQPCGATFSAPAPRVVQAGVRAPAVRA